MQALFVSKGKAALGAGLVLLLLAISFGQAAADPREFTQVAELNPRLEQKSALLGQRFDLVLARHQLELDEAAGRCRAGERRACELEDWLAYLADLEGLSEADQIYRVHRYVNRFRYVADSRNWQRADYWATPEELFEEGGDCEDYVIAKYLSLRALGIDAERLRVVVVYDRKKREDHAVLVVLGPEGTQVLDNYHRRVMSWDDMRERYSPYYSLNEKAVWMHSVRS